MIKWYDSELKSSTQDNLFLWTNMLRKRHG